MRRQLQYALRAILIVGQPPRAFNCLADVRDGPVAPSTDLVAKEPKPTCPAAADRTFGNDAALIAALVADRRLLDHEASVLDPNLERRVVEIARRPPPQPRGHRLVDATVEPNEVAAGAQRQPVEIDGGRDQGCRGAVASTVLKRVFVLDVAHGVILAIRVAKASGSARHDRVGNYGVLSASGARSLAELVVGGRRNSGR